MTTGLFGTN